MQRTSSKEITSLKQITSLKEILANQVGKYLQDDNKEPTTALEHFSYFFSSQGSSGRERANIYLRNVINDPENSSNEALLKAVWKTLSEDSPELGSSKLLKERIYQGLCEYYGISKQDVKSEWSKKRSEHMQAYRHMVSGVSAGPMVVPDYLKLNAYRSLLLRNEGVQAALAQNENPSFRLTGSDDNEGL